MTQPEAKCTSTSDDSKSLRRFSKGEAVPTDPAVSVVIPAYQAASHIGSALDSVFAQTFSDYEVIIINDGSPDTPDLERALEPYRSQIIYVEQENSGPSGARNCGILKARAPYVAFLDSDDLWESSFLSEQMKSLREDPSLDLVYADAILFGEGVPADLTFMQATRSHGPVTFESLLRFDCSIITSCVTARKKTLVDAGLFDPKFIRSEDYDLWLRMAYRGARMAYGRQVLARHRVHGGSLAADMTRMFESQIDVYEKLTHELPLSPQLLQLLNQQIKRCRADLAYSEGKRQFEAGQFSEAITALTAANEYYRSRKLRFVVACLRVAPQLLWRFNRLRDKTPRHA